MSTSGTDSYGFTLWTVRLCDNIQCNTTYCSWTTSLKRERGVQEKNSEIIFSSAVLISIKDEEDHMRQDKEGSN